MKVKKSALAAIFMLCMSILIAQQKTIFQDVSEGLSQETVTCMVQDKDGFLWVGTKYGLNRYDGLNYTFFDLSSIFKKPTNPNYINCLTLDEAQNVLWIGTYGSGIIKMNLDDYSFSQLESKDIPDTDKYILRILLDSEQQLWVGTENGNIYQVDQSNNSLKKALKYDISSLTKNFVSVIKEKNDFLFLGTGNKGLYRLNKRTNNIDHIILKDNPIRCLEVKDNGDCFIGSNDGVWSLKMNSLTPELILPELEDYVILSILIDNKDRLIIGTENEGLFIYHKDKLSSFTNDPLNKQSISGNSIWSLYQDDNAIIWIGLFQNGLNKIDDSVGMFKSVDFITHQGQLIDISIVTAFYETPQHIWIGTDRKGLYSYDKKTSKYSLHDLGTSPSKISILSINSDKNGILWIGAWNTGIIKYDPNTKSNSLINTESPKGNSLTSNFIKHVHKDTRGNVWISSIHSGIDIFDGDKFVRHLDESEVSSNLILSLANDCDGNLVVGTKRKGITILSFDESYNITKSKSTLVDSDKNSGYTINDIKVDNNCNIWVASDQGIFSINPRTLNTKQYVENDGLPSNIISAIEIDDNDNIWASTDKGIFSFNKMNKQVVSYGLESGLLLEEFNNKSSLKAEDGNIYFGNKKGINIYDSNEFSKNEIIPPVYITSYSKPNDDGVSEYFIDKSSKGETVFENESHDISFNFTALNFSLASKNKFKVRLLGLDEEWQLPNYKRTVEYRDLEPGKYTFQVMGSNNDGVWNPNQAEFSFRINEPWYNSWTAWLGWLFVLCIGTYAIYKSNTKKSKLKLKLAKDYRELEKLREVNKFNNVLFKNIRSDFFIPLQQIITQLKILAKDAQSETTIGNQNLMRNTTKLETFFNYVLKINKLTTEETKLKVGRYDLISFLIQIKEHHKPFADTKNISLNLVPDNEELMLFFDKQKLEVVFSNFLKSVIDISDVDSDIIVTVFQTNEEVQLIFKDTNEKTKREVLDEILTDHLNSNKLRSDTAIGVGIYIARHIIEMHHGEFLVERKNGTFKSLQVILKKGNAHFKEANLISNTSKSLASSRNTDNESKTNKSSGSHR